MTTVAVERRIATEPIEARGLRREDTRLQVSRPDGTLTDSTTGELADHLDSGDLLVVNTSATIPAALLALDGSVVVHLSTPMPGDLWLVEPRLPTAVASEPWKEDDPPSVLLLPAGGWIHLLERFRGGRLWLATLHLDTPALDYLAEHGRPIRYGHVPKDWPIETYQNAWSAEPGSAEMPSAGRGITAEVLARLAARGVGVAPIVLHCGVSSLESHEPPYPERFRVPAATASLVRHTHREGHRVIAVGTTVVRALESAVDDQGMVWPAEGWTELVVTPERGVRAVDGMITGWHEPEASHLQMLEAVAGRARLLDSYAAATSAGYAWHELGDAALYFR